jgi:DsbC/DsbD-like thiol-disulfide interchange protein
MRNSWLIAVVVLAAGFPVLADNAPVRARLLPGWTTAAGDHLVGIELVLAQGWKTYWRAPGDAGIPPSFNWSGSENLGRAEVMWPAPEVVYLQGMRSIVYTNQIVLPVRITPQQADAPLSLQLQIDMGVCRDVCMPYQIELTRQVEQSAHNRSPAIAAAMASRPYQPQEAGVTGTQCDLSPTPDGLRLTARMTMPTAGAPETVVVETGMSDTWISEANTRRSGDVLTSTVDIVAAEGGPIAIDREKLRITVLGTSHAVDIQGCARG